MIFPTWTSRRTMNKAQKATARLRYLVNRISADLGPGNSLKSIGDEIGMSYATILNYIDRGSFSEAMANLFEEHFDIPAMWLMDPMSIETTLGSSLRNEFLSAATV